jgi:hypothetical protein
MSDVRLATARDVLGVLLNARLIEVNEDSYGVPVKLTAFGRALTETFRGSSPDGQALDNFTVPGLFVRTDADA